MNIEDGPDEQKCTTSTSMVLLLEITYLAEYD